jgi:hypothetical protein
VGTLAAPGKPLVPRRGPTTGIKYVPTAGLQFHRTERIRLDLPVAGTAANASGKVLDRTGRTISVPARTDTRTEGGQTWVSADIALAPGDYLIRVTVDVGAGRQEIVQGFRVVP